MKTKIFFTILLTVFTLGIAFSQPPNKAKLDSLFNVLEKNNKAMGSLTLSKNGTVIYSRSIGYSFISDKEKKPASNLTKYRIGSISKMFTSTMIFQLVEEGKLKLTTTLDTYFPTIPNAIKITISNLLNHRSGIHNFTDNPGYISIMTQAKTHDEMLDIFSKNKADFSPDEKASYSNTNFVLLGYIIEKVTNQPYSKNLTDRITSKIGLLNTYYGGKTNIGNNESFSYRFINSWELEKETDMSIPGGAGAIVSTPTDLTKFIEALFSGKLVSQNSLNQMKTITDGYGMGMFEIPFNTKKAYGHNGGIDGFGSSLGYFPEDGLAVAYCTNGMVYPMNDILIGVLSSLFNYTYNLPAFKTITLKPEELNMYPGVYTNTELPLKITITKDKTTLIAQASGQPSFPLEASGKDKFEFAPAGIIIEFNLAKNELILKQRGGTFIFSKEK
jgi:D-alanyl-D-alanine carboxypeptidase